MICKGKEELMFQRREDEQCSYRRMSTNYMIMLVHNRIAISMKQINVGLEKLERIVELVGKM